MMHDVGVHTVLYIVYWWPARQEGIIIGVLPPIPLPALLASAIVGQVLFEKSFSDWPLGFPRGPPGYTEGPIIEHFSE